METLNQILSWLNTNETALSAIAALVVITGFTLSPLGAGLRALFGGGKNAKHQAVEPALARNQFDKQSTESINPASQDFLSTPPPLITDKPSIAVLPFVNMSDDKDKEFFADGMTEDIITGLS